MVGVASSKFPEFPVKVKNTFIDIDEQYSEYDNDDEWTISDIAKRQMSAPASSLVRQMSGGSPLKGMRTVMMPGDEIAEEEEEEDLEVAPAPKRQSSFEETFDTSAWDRMVTGGSLCGFDAPIMSAGMKAILVEQNVGQPWAMNLMYAQGPGAGFPFHGTGPADLSAMAAADAMTIPLVLPADSVNGSVMPPPEWANTTTVMMRNLPNKYTQNMLFNEMSHTGFEGAFDFLYLPIDPETSANKGYAFVNFIDPGRAWMFKMAFDGRRMNRFNSVKRISVMPAALQGFEANHAHYSQARVNQGDKNSRPLFLREPKLSAPSGQEAAGGSTRGRRRRGGRGSLIDRAAAQQQESKVQHNLNLGDRQQQEQRQLQVLLQQQQMLLLQQQSFQNMDGLADGGMLNVLSDKTDNSASLSRDGMKFCPWCGSKVEDAFHFCQYCGKSLESQQ